MSLAAISPGSASLSVYSLSLKNSYDADVAWVVADWELERYLAHSIGGSTEHL
jgi:hypothetical protein